MTISVIFIAQTLAFSFSNALEVYQGSRFEPQTPHLFSLRKGEFYLLAYLTKKIVHYSIRGDVPLSIHLNLIPFSLSMSSSYPMKEDQSSTNQELSREPKQ
ncbi:hypothetical protein MTR_3g011780 [Medicago truncatula]|uniref:Transmembrane protein n=1 Tax=Medicago truncatula TaxID=3880 RepID=A0A072UT05_MEDTR|nr:hypothetical protein MTR_3g011780 [Medicago truncatula]